MSKELKVSRGTARAARRIGMKQGSKRAAITDNKVATNMRPAFEGITIIGFNAHMRDTVETILTSLKQGSGMVKTGRGWIANLQPHTVRKLVNEGVFA